jgi:hypothetical protein
MLQDVLDSISSKISGLPYYTPTGVRKGKPVTIPVVSCPTFRQAPNRQMVMTVNVTLKNPVMTQLYTEMETIIDILTLPGILDWRLANVYTGTDGHYGELVFEHTSTMKSSAPVFPLTNSQVSYNAVI